MAGPSQGGRRPSTSPVNATFLSCAWLTRCRCSTLLCVHVTSVGHAISPKEHLSSCQNPSFVLALRMSLSFMQICQMFPFMRPIMEQKAAQREKALEAGFNRYHDCRLLSHTLAKSGKNFLVRPFAGWLGSIKQASSPCCHHLSHKVIRSALTLLLLGTLLLGSCQTDSRPLMV